MKKFYSNPLFALRLLSKYVGFVYNVLFNDSALLGFWKYLSAIVREIYPQADCTFLIWRWPVKTFPRASSTWTCVTELGWNNTEVLKTEGSCCNFFIRQWQCKGNTRNSFRGKSRKNNRNTCLIIFPREFAVWRCDDIGSISHHFTQCKEFPLITLVTSIHDKTFF